MKTILAILLLAPLQAFAWCGYMGLSGAWSVPGNGTMVPLSWTSAYSHGTWSWNTQLPADTYLYVTDIIFQSKNVQTGGSTRSSYLVINGFITVAEHMGGQIHFSSPMIVPPGTTLTGAFINQSTETQNMIAILTGYAWDSVDCRDRFKK